MNQINLFVFHMQNYGMINEAICYRGFTDQSQWEVQGKIKLKWFSSTIVDWHWERTDRRTGICLVLQLWEIVTIRTYIQLGIWKRQDDEGCQKVWRCKMILWRMVVVVVKVLRRTVISSFGKGISWMDSINNERKEWISLWKACKDHLSPNTSLSLFRMRLLDELGSDRGMSEPWSVHRDA